MSTSPKPDRRTSPIADRRLLGDRLTRAREAAGVGRDDAARHIKRSAALLSRIEHGRVGIEAAHVQRLAKLYDLDDEATQELVNFSISSGERGWWVPYGVPDHLRDYVGLETVADELLTYEQVHIPALLQTEAYARAIQAGASAEPQSVVSVEKIAGLRRARQARLADEPPLRVDAVIAETALAWMVGGPQVMAEQIRHLIAASRQRYITIRVLMANTGAHPAMSGAYSLLRFRENPRLDTVYLEHWRGTYLEEDSQVKTYVATHDLLRRRAMGVEDSRRWLATVADDLSRREEIH